MAGIFKFKQFDVDQSGCAMKINTDGVLLGAFAEAEQSAGILDIGTGTGVIALMLAQKFSKAQIDAVEIDSAAAETAASNFENSPFKERVAVYQSSFQDYFKQYPERKYGLIISNPPFYINSLESPGEKINLAKHAGATFFEELVACIATQLSPNGSGWMILPIPTARLVKSTLPQYNLFISKVITIRSFADAEPHREILVFSKLKTPLGLDDFVIYDEPRKYSEAYQHKLRDFFTIF